MRNQHEDEENQQNDENIEEDDDNNGEYHRLNQDEVLISMEEGEDLICEVEELEDERTGEVSHVFSINTVFVIYQKDGEVIPTISLTPEIQEIFTFNQVRELELQLDNILRRNKFSSFMKLVMSLLQLFFLILWIAGKISLDSDPPNILIIELAESFSHSKLFPQAPFICFLLFLSMTSIRFMMNCFFQLKRYREIHGLILEENNRMRNGFFWSQAAATHPDPDGRRPLLILQRDQHSVVMLEEGRSVSPVLTDASPLLLLSSSSLSPLPLASEMSSGLRDDLIRFYHQHNPSRVNDVDEILRRYLGRENELLRRLSRQYPTSHLHLIVPHANEQDNNNEGP